MPAQPILRIGHPLLLQQAEAVREFNTPALHALVTDMLDTMREADGAGLAAPQIGVLQRVVVFEVRNNPRYPGRGPIPLTILVNPHITPLDEETEEDWEGCLSVPRMRGWVPRYRRIRYTAHDPAGNLVEREAEGFHARVVQHECDHLDGILYPQRIRDLRKFGFEEELFQGGAAQAAAG
jgi:peptide deformylase